MWSTVSIADKSILIHDPPTAPQAGVLFLLDDTSPPFAHRNFRSFVERSPYLWLFAFPEQSWWCEVVYPPFHSDISPGDFARKLCVEWLRKRVGSPNIALVGSGSGGQAALKWAFRDPADFPTVVAFDPAIDLFEIHGNGYTLDDIYPTAELLRQQSASLDLQSYPFPDSIWLAASPDSIWHRGCDRLHEKLNVLGAVHTFDLYAGDPTESDWFSADILNSLDRFLASNLSKPLRRRLL